MGEDQLSVKRGYRGSTFSHLKAALLDLKIVQGVVERTILQFADIATYVYLKIVQSEFSSKHSST